MLTKFVPFHFFFFIYRPSTLTHARRGTIHVKKPGVAILNYFCRHYWLRYIIASRLVREQIRNWCPFAESIRPMIDAKLTGGDSFYPNFRASTCPWSSNYCLILHFLPKSSRVDFFVKLSIRPYFHRQEYYSILSNRALKIVVEDVFARESRRCEWFYGLLPLSCLPSLSTILKKKRIPNDTGMVT